MSADVIPITRAVEIAWQAYSEAAKVAQRSLRIEDGIAAGRAWARWLELFVRKTS